MLNCKQLVDILQEEIERVENMKVPMTLLARVPWDGAITSLHGAISDIFRYEREMERLKEALK